MRYVMLALILTGCAGAQNADVIVTPSDCDVVDYDYKSYYTADRGTVNLHYNVNPCGVTVKGEPLEGVLFVASDIAGSLRKVTNNQVKTLIFNGHSVDDLELKGNTLHYTSMGSVFEYDTITESIVSETYGAVGKCSKRGMVCRNNGVTVDNDYVIEAEYPRDAQRANGFIYVADTFGHKVIIYDESLKAVVSEVEIYYPNSIQIKGNSLVVTAEHHNMIVSIDLTTRQKSVLYGCNQGAYNDVNTSVADLMASEAAGVSVCQGKLYSPNHATVQDNGDLLIADTDNHRVLIVRNGHVITEITGLNNPTRVVLK